MKKILIGLLILASAGLDASYETAIGDKVVAISQRVWYDSPWFQYAHEGNVLAMQAELNQYSADKRSLLVNAKDVNGANAMIRAVNNGQDGVVAFLLKNGIKLTDTNNASVNPLEGAARLIVHYKKCVSRANPRTIRDIERKAWKNVNLAH